jgi:hypothetical protein
MMDVTRRRRGKHRLAQPGRDTRRGNRGDIGLRTVRVEAVYQIIAGAPLQGIGTIGAIDLVYHTHASFPPARGQERRIWRPGRNKRFGDRLQQFYPKLRCGKRAVPGAMSVPIDIPEQREGEPDHTASRLEQFAELARAMPEVMRANVYSADRHILWSTNKDLAVCGKRFLEPASTQR